MNIYICKYKSVRKAKNKKVNESIKKEFFRDLQSK